MVHLDLKFGYHAIKTKNPPESEEITEMFIGRFKSDNQYHLLGYRSEGSSAYFSESSETNLDLGVIQLPKNREKLTDLLQDEIFFFYPIEEKDKFYPIKYISHCN